MEVAIPRTYFEKNGDKQFAVKLRNVDIIPESHYNLMSITKLTEENHKLSGNNRTNP